MFLIDVIASKVNNRIVPAGHFQQQKKYSRSTGLDLDWRLCVIAVGVVKSIILSVANRLSRATGGGTGLTFFFVGGSWRAVVRRADGGRESRTDRTDARIGDAHVHHHQLLGNEK